MAVMKVKQGDQWINIPSITGAPGPQGPQGNTGNSGVHVGSTEPTDPDVNVWVYPDGEVSIDDVFVLTAPNGTQYKVVVANDGTLSTQAI